MKKNKRKKISSPSFLPRWLVINAVYLLVLVSVVVVIVASLKRSECFLIRQVIIREKDDISNGESMFAYFKGKNIFAVNLDREAARIAMSYPSYRKIRLTRYLPDCILVDVLRRIPVASIHAEKNCYVDKNGYSFDQPGEGSNLDLPVITGLERKMAQVRQGRAGAMNEVALSLLVVSRIRQDKAFAAYRIRTIDVSAPDNLIFFLCPPGFSARAMAGPLPAEKEAIEVRVGADAIPAKIQILSSVLTQMRSTVENIKYIDLRFKEPVIKFKNMEKFARR